MKPRSNTQVGRQSRRAEASAESERFRHIADLLGGPKVVGKYPTDPLAAHEMLQRGLPNIVINHLFGRMMTLAPELVESALGISLRTRQRREKHPMELLSQGADRAHLEICGDSNEGDAIVRLASGR